MLKYGYGLPYPHNLKFLSLKPFSRNLARDNNNGDENNDKSKQAMVAFANFDLCHINLFDINLFKNLVLSICYYLVFSDIKY